MLICAPIIGLWYWCTDQYIVQRVLGAPDERIARRGGIFAAFLKLFQCTCLSCPGLSALHWQKAARFRRLPAWPDSDSQAIVSNNL